LHPKARDGLVILGNPPRGRGAREKKSKNFRAHPTWETRRNRQVNQGFLCREQPVRRIGRAESTDENVA
jgi:hypothetical protein